MPDSLKCGNCRYRFLLDREKELNMSAKNADILIPSYARFMKMAAERIEWKLETYRETKKKRPKGEIILVPNDIKNLRILEGKIEQHLIMTPVDIKKEPPTINESFHLSSETDALDYFDKKLSEKVFFDAIGEKIFIPEDSYLFMYKDPDTGEHILESKNYVYTRGQRLSYIPFIIRSSKCILERPYRYDRNDTIDRMYLHAFSEVFNQDSPPNLIYMAVIVLRDRKKNKPTVFKTAFPFSGELDLCRRIGGGYSFVEIKK